MGTPGFELVAVPPASAGGTAIPVVRVRGEVDTTNAAALQRALADRASGGLVVDLSDVGYFDSAGFAVLDRLLGQGAVAVVVAPGSVVHTAMKLLDLPFYESAETAITALGQPT